MFEQAAFLQTYSFVGGDIGNILAQWEQIGVFAYALPFLLLFALVFGILTRVKIFDENKAINVVISLSVSLMALQYNFVPQFFSQLFPQVGIGLTFILMAIIFLGLSTNTNWTWMLTVVGVIIIVVIMVNSFDVGNTTFGMFFSQHFATIIFSVILIGFLIAMMFYPINLNNKHDNFLAQAIRGGGN